MVLDENRTPIMSVRCTAEEYINCTYTGGEFWLGTVPESLFFACSYGLPTVCASFTAEDGIKNDRSGVLTSLKLASSTQSLQRRQFCCLLMCLCLPGVRYSSRDGAFVLCGLVTVCTDALVTMSTSNELRRHHQTLDV